MGKPLLPVNESSFSNFEANPKSVTFILFWLSIKMFSAYKINND